VAGGVDPVRDREEQFCLAAG
jgi:16S rRNA (guanine527-N7)-methyltransferase